MTKIEVDMVATKITKNKVRFEAADKDAPVDCVYIRKENLIPAAPQRVKVTVEAVV